MAFPTGSNNRQTISRDGRSSSYVGSMSDKLKNKTIGGFSVLDTPEEKNTKYKYFQKVGLRRPEAIAKQSITLSNDFNNTAFSTIERDKSFSDIMYATVSEDKAGRLNDYRMMASFSEIADALDEICDECINPDNDDEIVKLKIKGATLDSDIKEEIQKEFHRYVEHYDLHNNGWQYFRQFLIEGELFFEQIIHEDYTNKGVLGVVNIPSDLIDPVYSNIQNLLVKGFLYQKPIFNTNDPKRVDKYEAIPYEENQIVYISNQSFNDTREYIIPFIENARRAYRQLSMIEDAVVIHRMVHAPLRFVFNVDTGTLPVPKAEAYLRKLQSQYWSTKTFDIDQGDIVKKYSPQSTLDSFWFAKRQGQEPTTVQTIGGQMGDDQMESLYFFIKKLYRSLKTPTSRLDPQDAFQDGTNVLREELKFAKMIMRHQQKFAAGIKRGFITHLKLMGLFNENDLEEQHIVVTFEPPTNFYELRNNQKLEMKVNTLNTLLGTQQISVSLGMKKILGWDDKTILANLEFRRKEAAIDWELEQIRSMGPNFREVIKQQTEASTGGGDIGGGGLGGGMDSSIGALGGNMGEQGTPPEGGMAPAGPDDTSIGLGQEEPPNAGNAPA